MYLYVGRLLSQIVILKLQEKINTAGIYTFHYKQRDKKIGEGQTDGQADNDRDNQTQ